MWRVTKQQIFVRHIPAIGIKSYLPEETCAPGSDSQMQAYPRVPHAHPTKVLSVVSSSLAQTTRRFVIGIVLATSTVFTQTMPSFADGAPFSRKLKQNKTIISNELSETLVQEGIQINEQAIVEHFSQITVPVNEHFTEAQIVEAATIKADGRRLDVPQDKILVSSQPNAPVLGIFMADVKSGR